MMRKEIILFLLFLPVFTSFKLPLTMPSQKNNNDNIINYTAARPRRTKRSFTSFDVSSPIGKLSMQAGAQYSPVPIKLIYTKTYVRILQGGCLNCYKSYTNCRNSVCRAFNQWYVNKKSKFNQSIFHGFGI